MLDLFEVELFKLIRKIKFKKQIGFFFFFFFNGMLTFVGYLMPKPFS